MSGLPRLRDLLPRRAQLHGASPAVVSDGVVVDYRQLAARAAAAAEGLRSTGIGAGVQVALALQNSVDYLATFFGILEAGGVVVPISPSATAPEIDARCEEGGIGWIVARPGPLVRRTRFAPLPVASDPGDGDGVVARQFSSGSTGRPRAILRTGSSLSADAAHFAATLGIGPDDRFLGVAPFHHAFGGLSFLAAFPVGASVSVLPRFLPAPLLEAARRDRPTILLATPPMISVLGTCVLGPGEEAALGALRHCVCSGGPLATAAHDAFVARFGVPVRVQYGSTETLAATIDLDGGFEEGRVGRPFEGVTVRILDDDGAPLPPGAPGRVAIRSPAACDGYANDPVATAERFRGGYVLPGDRGTLDGRGVLRLLGRSDVINVGGLKVDPLEVAGAIRAALPVTAAEVLAWERSGVPAIVAVVEADPGRVTPAMVVAACRGRLSAHKVPARVEVVRRLPRNGAGKVVRAEVEAWLRARRP